MHLFINRKNISKIFKVIQKKDLNIFPEIQFFSNSKTIILILYKSVLIYLTNIIIRKFVNLICM